MTVAALKNEFPAQESKTHKAHVTKVSKKGGGFALDVRLLQAVIEDGIDDAVRRTLDGADIYAKLPDTIQKQIDPASQPYLLSIDDPSLPFNQTGLLIDRDLQAKQKRAHNLNGQVIVFDKKDGTRLTIPRLTIERMVKNIIDGILDGDWEQYQRVLNEQTKDYLKNPTIEKLFELVNTYNQKALSLASKGFDAYETAEAKAFQAVHAKITEIVQSEEFKTAPEKALEVAQKLLDALTTKNEFSRVQKRATESFVISFVALAATTHGVDSHTNTFVNNSLPVIPVSSAHTQTIDPSISMKPSWDPVVAQNDTSAVESHTPSWTTERLGNTQPHHSTSRTSAIFRNVTTTAPAMPQAQSRVTAPVESRATGRFPAGFFAAEQNLNGSILAGIDDRQLLDKLYKYEAFIPYMYLCSEGYITVGLGEMMSNASEALKVNFTYRSYDGKIVRPATDTEEKQAWERMNNTRQERKGRYKQFNAEEYNPQQMTFLSNLVIDEKEAERLAIIKLKGFVQDLREIYPDFDTFPRSARLVLLDMIYNMGRGELEKDMPNTKRMINNREWSKIAPTMISHYNEIGMDRKRAREKLFEAADREDKAYIATNENRMVAANNNTPRQPN